MQTATKGSHLQTEVAKLVTAEKLQAAIDDLKCHYCRCKADKVDSSLQEESMLLILLSQQNRYYLEHFDGAVTATKNLSIRRDSAS